MAVGVRLLVCVSVCVYCFLSDDVVQGLVGDESEHQTRHISPAL